MRLEIVGVRVGSPLGAPCSSYAVDGPEGTVLLDCGPGTLQAAWSSGLVDRLGAVVISHMHLDHMLDLVPWTTTTTREGLEHRLGAARRLPLWVPRGRGPAVLEEAHAAFGHGLDRVRATFDLREYDAGDTVRACGLELTFVRTGHPETCLAPRCTDGTTTLVYTADSTAAPALERHAAGADLLLCEATFLDPGPDLDRYGHMTGEQAAGLAARAGVQRLVLTHVMPFEDENAENLRRARARFDGRVDLAEPGRVYEIG
ncbi:MAG TPA: MBL fold metallo-hydrolase [Solirubrobacteraceae bacterium]|jgi:ribonuclease BN (tRNA processing enzyme)|nr:MBL fold metallo-hydrolase [Solirubrobacteraceae bacterium]